MDNKAAITAIEYYLPPGKLTNEQLAEQFPEWAPDKISAKTGIYQRHVADEETCSSDLGVAAAKLLFGTGCCTPGDIEFVLLCTQSPDYFLPTTACLIQDRLGIPTTAGALDFNLGCSGYVYGLSLAKGLVETGQARKVLLIAAETYSKFIHPEDRSVRTLFGDAGAATLVEALQGTESEYLGPFVFGTDGSGGGNLIVPTGGLRCRPIAEAEVITDASGSRRTANHLYMNGAEIFTFTLATVPGSVSAVLSKSGLSLGDIDLFVFHQANAYMLEHLRRKCNIPPDRYYVAMEDCGNTVSCSIPIALKRAQTAGVLQAGMKVMLVAFGVGYSWGATLVDWVAGGDQA